MNKRKQILRRCIFFLAVGIAVILLCGAFSARGQPQVQEYDTVQGDTLWGIAKEHKPNSMSYRKYITYLYKLNDGLTAEIYPGERILVPVYEERR